MDKGNDNGSNIHWVKGESGNNNSSGNGSTLAPSSLSIQSDSSQSQAIHPDAPVCQLGVLLAGGG